MKLKSGISTNPKHNGGTTVMFKGRQRTFGEIALFDEIKKLGLNRDSLLQRWIAGKKTEKELFQPKRLNNAKKYNNIKKSQIRAIPDLGKHPEKKPGEILIHYCSEDEFKKLNYWDTQRLGATMGENPRLVSHGKRPLFVNISEAIDRKWEIVETRPY